MTTTGFPQPKPPLDLPLQESFFNTLAYYGNPLPLVFRVTVNVPGVEYVSQTVVSETGSVAAQAMPTESTPLQCVQR